MVGLIQKLEKRYKIALATNEGETITKYKITASGVSSHLSDVIASYAIHEIKPSPQFFHKTLAILDVQPEECVFIDDMQQNVDATKSLGITSVLFKDAKQLERALSRLKIL